MKTPAEIRSAAAILAIAAIQYDDRGECALAISAAAGALEWTLDMDTNRAKKLDRDLVRNYAHIDQIDAAVRDGRSE